MKFDFVEIGTSDFDTLLETSINEIGLTIEPLKFYLDNLPDKSSVIKVNCAISDRDENVDIFWIDPIDITNYDLPSWLRGCNSIVTPHKSAIKELQDRNLEHIYKKSKCKCITWSKLVEIYDIKYVGYLKIDTEGHDCTILNNILDSNSVLPKKILFENNILSEKSQVDKILERLKENGYIILQTGENILLEKA